MVLFGGLGDGRRYLDGHKVSDVDEMGGLERSRVATSDGRYFHVVNLGGRAPAALDTIKSSEPKGPSRHRGRSARSRG